MKKKVVEFEVRDMLPIGLTFVVLGIGLTYGLNVQGEVKDEIGEANCAAATAHNMTDYNSSISQCFDGENYTQVGTAEFNSSLKSIQGVGKIPEKMPLIATVVVAAIIIGILVRYLMVRFT